MNASCKISHGAAAVKAVAGGCGRFCVCCSGGCGRRCLAVDVAASSVVESWIKSPNSHCLDGLKPDDLPVLTQFTRGLPVQPSKTMVPLHTAAATATCRSPAGRSGNRRLFLHISAASWGHVPRAAGDRSGRVGQRLACCVIFSDRADCLQAEFLHHGLGRRQVRLLVLRARGRGRIASAERQAGAASLSRTR